MRLFPPSSARSLLLVVAALWIAGPAPGRDTAEAVYQPYRADLEAAVPAGSRPARIQLLAPPGENAWSGPPADALAERIRREWTGQVPYGAIRPGVPLVLTYPLVTTAERDRVLVQAEKSTRIVALYLACLRRGAVYVPLNSAYTAPEVAHFLADAEPALFVCAPGAEPASAALASGPSTSGPCCRRAHASWRVCPWR